MRLKSYICELAAKLRYFCPKRPKVSVVIPCYNAAQFLPDLYTYIEQQTFKNFEVIFVDDKSTDNSVNLIEEFKKKDNRISLIKLSQNLGAGNARNEGLKHVRGKYLIFLDTDDIYKPNMLEEVYNTAEKYKTDITMFKSVCFDDAAKTYTNEDIWWLWTPPYPVNTVFGPNDVQDTLFTFCRGALWNKLFKTSFVRKNKLKFLNLKRHNDSFFVYSAYALANSMYVMDKVLIVYRINNNNSITGKEDCHIECSNISIAALENFLKEKNLCDKYKNALIEYKRTY